MKRWSIALLVAILVLLPVSTVFGQDGEFAFQQGVVNTAEAMPIRAEQSLSAEVLGQVAPGEVVDVYEVDGIWAWVSYEDVEGWTFAADLDLRDAQVDLSGEVVADVLAVRAEKSISADTVDTVEGGEMVGVLVLTETWAYVYTGDALGWAFNGDLALSEDTFYVDNFLKDMAAVASDVLAVRAEPSIGADVLFTLEHGDMVDVMYEEGIFSYVWYGDEGGWAFSADLDVTQPRAYGVGVPTDLRVNFRSEPDTSDNYNIITQLPEGTEVLLLGQTEDGTWLNVRYEGEEGWVSTELIETEYDVTMLPVTG